MAAPVIHDYGDRALLLECGSGDEVLALTDVLRDATLPGVLDIVPGARTVLVSLTEPRFQSRTRALLSAIEIGRSGRPRQPDRADVVIDVAYGGADLEEVADLLQLEPRAVVDAHTGTPWRVGFVGFAPGFAYLVGGDPRLHVPRRAEPRTRVPAGAVALAGGYSGVYPRESPGGWQLIGGTESVLWDPNRSNPALLTPGMWVRFRALDTP